MSVLDAVEAGFASMRGHGIYDLKNAANPLRTRPHIIVPYCTGDMHLGNEDVTHHPPKSTGMSSHTKASKIYHRGAVNTKAVLSWLKEHYPQSAVRSITLVGCSAGGFASTLYATHLTRMYPDASIVVVADGAASVPDVIFPTVWKSWGIKAGGAWPEWIPKFKSWAAEFDRVITDMTPTSATSMFSFGWQDVVAAILEYANDGVQSLEAAVPPAELPKAKTSTSVLPRVRVGLLTFMQDDKQLHYWTAAGGKGEDASRSLTFS